MLLVKVLNGSEYGFHSYSVSFWRYAGVTLPAIPMVMYYEWGNKDKDVSVFDSVWPLNRSDKWWTIFGLFVSFHLSHVH